MFVFIIRPYILCSVDPASLYNLVNKANFVHSFPSRFISFLYLFRATMCPSSGEKTVSMRHLVIVTLKQVDILKLQELISSCNQEGHIFC
jgi:hypothetical protein